MQEITIYRLEKNKKIFEIVPLKVKRKWMTDSHKKTAYKCLPLKIASQYGWAVLCPIDFSVNWWGGKDPNDVEIIFDDIENEKIFGTYFGESTFTLHLDFVVQTPENYSLYIRGVPNSERNGIIPLDAIVETDWLPFTFTYNFRMAEPGTYNFKKGEPLFIFFPIERNTVENFIIKESNIENNPAFKKDYDGFVEHAAESWSREAHPGAYLKGQHPSGKKYNIKNHITKLLFGGKDDKIND